MPKQHVPKPKAEFPPDIQPDNKPIPAKPRTKTSPSEMPPPRFPPLDEHLTFLKKEAGIPTDDMLHDIACTFIDRARGHQNMSRSDLSNCRTGQGKRGYPEEHVVALHKALGLDQYFPSPWPLWGVWPASSDAREFQLRPYDDFRKRVEDAKARAPSLIAQIHREGVNPRFKVSFQGEASANFVPHKKRRASDEVVDVTPPTILTEGHLASIRCHMPAPGYLAFVQSFIEEDEADGSRHRRYVRLNPYLGLRTRPRPELTYQSEPRPVLPPVLDYQLLALFWPSEKPFPLLPVVRWAFASGVDVSTEPEDYRPHACDRSQMNAILAAMFEARMACGPDEPKPEVTAITYFVVPKPSRSGSPALE